MPQEWDAQSRTALARRPARGAAGLAAVFVALAHAPAALAAPAETTVTLPSNPLMVYAVLAVLLGSVTAAFVFSRPRRGPSAVKSSETHPSSANGGLPWMPGGDILGGESETQPEAVAPPSISALPPVGPSPARPPSPPPPGQPAMPADRRTARIPWSTGAPGPAQRWR
jgi:hypothetical protein